MSFPRCIFTVTTGRSGSNYLTELLARCPGVVSRHEPRPNFVHCMRHIQLHPELGKEFLLEDKAPAIKQAARGRIYAETSHLFCKGFLEAWIQLPELPVPDLILLHRDYRMVAKSMLSLATTPARTLRGAKWYLSPADDTCYTRVEDWQTLNDYQLCYWYCLETDARKRLYGEWIRRCGGTVADVELESLNTEEGFDRLRTSLSLPAVGIKGKLLAFIQRNRPVNTKTRKKRIDVSFDSAQLSAWEHEVAERTTQNDAACTRLAALREDVAALRSLKSCGVE